MNKYLTSITALAVALAGAVSTASAKSIEKSNLLGPYKVELHVLPPEPFYSQAQIDSRNIHQGMVREGGKQPVEPKSSLHPNHHLIVQIVNAQSGKPVTNAKVRMDFQPITKHWQPTGKLVKVPVVKMEAIGKGAVSTHYGNNVRMPSGRCEVYVFVNGRTTLFKVNT